MIKASGALATLLALAVVGIGPASAQASRPQDPKEQAALRQACTGDYLRFCGNIPPDSPAVEQCFATNMKQLSPQCQQTIAAYTKKDGKSR